MNDPAAVLARLIRWVMRDARYVGDFPATVERDNGDNTIDVRPDDGTLAGQGLQCVPITPGLPAVATRIEQGARCLLAFENGDPRKPHVRAWEFRKDSATVTFDGGAGAVARKGDLVLVETLPVYQITGVIGGTAKQPNPSPPPLTIDIPVPPGTNFVGAAVIATPVYGVVIGGAAKVTA